MDTLDAMRDRYVAFDGEYNGDPIIVFHDWDDVRHFYGGIVDGVGSLTGVTGHMLGCEPDFSKRFDNDPVVVDEYVNNCSYFVVYVREDTELTFRHELLEFCGWQRCKDTEHKNRFDQMMKVDAERSVSEDGQTVAYVFPTNAMYCVWALIETEKADGDKWISTGRKPEFAFTDEYDECVECSKVLRTSPTHYGWKPDYFLSEAMNGLLCLDCLRKDTDFFFEQMEALYDTGKAVGSPLPPEELGYEQVIIHDSYGTKTTWQSGLHHGMSDNADAQFKKLRAGGIEIPLFVFEPSQFYVEWEIWVKPEDMEKAEEILQAACNDGSDQARPSPNEKMKDFLKNAPVTKVSAKDFIDGNIPEGPVKLEIDCTGNN